jgi:ADP-ribose pyrophosphatase
LTALFLHFPFDTPGLLARVTGAEAGPGPVVTLEGHRLASDEHGLRVALTQGPGAIKGRLVQLDRDQRARLDFAMAAFGARPFAVTVTVTAAGGTAPALAYCFDPGAVPEDTPPGEGEALARLAEALDEIAGHFGGLPAEVLPGLLHGIGVRALGRSRGALRRAPLVLGSPLGTAEVEPIERRQPYARYFGIEEHLLRHRRFDGAMSAPLQRAVFTSGDAVVVLPYDPRHDAVLLIEQFRAGPWARRDPRPWVLETVAGRCDRNEPPEQTARREAREEAGLELGRVERIGSFYPSPAIMSEFITAFVGEAELAAAGGVYGLAEEHEDIRAIAVPLEAALAAVDDGEIDTAPLMLALLWLRANAERLRREWA